MRAFFVSKKPLVLFNYIMLDLKSNYEAIVFLRMLLSFTYIRLKQTTYI